MNINLKKQKQKIKKFLLHFHGRERVNLYDVFRAVAYIVYICCQWKMLPTYYPRPTTVYYQFIIIFANGANLIVL